MRASASVRRGRAAIVGSGRVRASDAHGRGVCPCRAGLLPFLRDPQWGPVEESHKPAMFISTDDLSGMIDREKAEWNQFRYLTHPKAPGRDMYSYTEDSARKVLLDILMLAEGDFLLLSAAGSSSNMTSSITYYVEAYYWAVSVTTGVGVVPTPNSHLEALFNGIISFLGMLLQAYTLGSAASALSTLDASKAERHRKIDMVKQYMYSKRVPLYLREKITDCKCTRRVSNPHWTCIALRSTIHTHTIPLVTHTTPRSNPFQTLSIYTRRSSRSTRTRS